MLVLIDGRNVYTPLFAGVYWDVQDMPLEDIDLEAFESAEKIAALIDGLLAKSR